MRSKKNNKLVISCDGGAASGKTTGAKLIAKKYGMKFLSSGLLYRYASFQLLKFKPKNKIIFLNKCFKNFSLNRLGNKNLHSPKISAYTSIIAKQQKIRNILKVFQIKFSKKYKKVVIEGRDIQTKILPNADIKFFISASAEIRARRRYEELLGLGHSISLNKVLKDIQERDERDSNRKNSPLVAAVDAKKIDTSDMTIAEVYESVSRVIESELKK